MFDFHDIAPSSSNVSYMRDLGVLQEVCRLESVVNQYWRIRFCSVSVRTGAGTLSRSRPVGVGRFGGLVDTAVA